MQTQQQQWSGRTILTACAIALGACTVRSASDQAIADSTAAPSATTPAPTPAPAPDTARGAPPGDSATTPAPSPPPRAPAPRPSSAKRTADLRIEVDRAARRLYVY